MKLYLCCALMLLLASCGGKKKESENASQPPKVTVPPTTIEQAGVKEVTDFYGGRCNFSAGITDRSRKRFARLEISNSPALDSAMKITELNLANMALMFYKDLMAERGNFDEIQTAIKFGNGQDAEKAYPVSLLAMVLDKSAIVDSIVQVLKRQQYSSLDTLLDDQSDMAHFDKKKLIAGIKNADHSIGKIRSFVRYGFIMIKADNGKNVLHISGMMLRDRKNNEFSVDIDPSSTKNKAIFINYKL